MANLSLRNIRKSFDQVEVVRGVSFDVSDRQFAVLVGPSGCGKSTLLRLIAGLEDSTAGDVFIDGERVNDVPSAGRGLAMVFQSYALYPHMTVFENLSFGLKLAGIPREERERKAAEAARILHLEPLLRRRPRELSGGEKQRVAIGRAIVRNPRAFLFDEPLSNLDAALRAQMRFEILRLHDALNATTLYVTHDQVEAMTMADKIIVLRAGVVEQSGSPLDLYNKPQNLFVAGFIGSPAMNIFRATVTDVSEATIRLAVDGGTVLELPARPGVRAGEDVSVGVRPEHLSLAQEGQFRGEVLVAEHLGPATFVHVRVESGALLNVAAAAASSVSVHDRVAVRVSSPDCHLFDREGNAIRGRS